MSWAARSLAMSMASTGDEISKSHLEIAREDMRDKRVKFSERIVGDDLILAVTKYGKPIRAWAYDPATGAARGSRPIRAALHVTTGVRVAGRQLSFMEDENAV